MFLSKGDYIDDLQLTIADKKTIEGQGLVGSIFLVQPSYTVLASDGASPGLCYMDE